MTSINPTVFQNTMNRFNWVENSHIWRMDREQDCVNKLSLMHGACIQRTYMHNLLFAPLAIQKSMETVNKKASIHIFQVTNGHE